MAQEVAAAPAVTVAPFGDRVAAAVDRKHSQLLVGLDPRVELLPVELGGGADAAVAVERFCCAIVDAVAPYVVGVKVQIAFFEALGAPGIEVFERVCAYGRTAGLLVVA